MSVMVSSLRDPQSQKESGVSKTSATLPETSPWEAEERRPPVLGVVLAFIVVFWGGLFLLWRLFSH